MPKAIFQAAYTLLTSLAKQVPMTYPLAFSPFPDKVNYYLWDFPDFGLFSKVPPQKKGVRNNSIPIFFVN